MNKFGLIAAGVFVLASVGFGFSGDMGEGTDPLAGSSWDHPWLIEDFDDFDEFISYSSYWDDCTRLDCDLDLSAAGTYFQAPVGRGTPFTGIFDGNGHIIRNLTVDGGSFCGLFGTLEAGAVVKNLGLENASITSTSNYVGGLVGYNYGSITNSYSSGEATGNYYVGGLVGYNYGGSITNSYSSVEATGNNYVGGLVGCNYDGSITNSYSSGEATGNDYVGGLVGDNYGSITSSYSTGAVDGQNRVGGLVGIHSGSITSSYSTGAVDGQNLVGGLVGHNYGSITNSYSIGTVTNSGNFIGGLCGINDYGIISNCYAVGLVTGGVESEYTGGLCGKSSGNSISNCFWDTQSSGTTDGVGNKDPDPAGVTGKTTDEMKTKSTFTDAGWDFAIAWALYDDSIMDGYPYLGHQMSFSSSGSGTELDPYLIADVNDLQVFAANMLYWGNNIHTKLMCDLDLNGTTYATAVIAPNTSGSSDFIGTAFAGVFDGNGHVIRNLTVDGTSYCGLFGKLDNGSEVKDLGMEDVSITTSGDYVGGLAGRNYRGNITDSYSTGTVTGNDCVGGFMGGSSDGNITSCYSTGTVTGNDDVGGLLGYSSDSQWIDSSGITYCYSTGSVTGSWYVGGLVGVNSSDWNCSVSNITSSYSTGDVTGIERVGGLVGCLRDGDDIISNSYSTGSVTGSRFVGGLLGVIENGTFTSSYSTGTVTGSGGGLVGGHIGFDGSASNSYFYIYSGEDNGYGTALDDEQLQDKNSFAGFDFAGDSSDGTEDYWTIEPGYMPRLTWQESPGFENPLDAIITTLSGTGYPGDPFVISSYADLMEFRNNSALRIGDYSLTNDIDLAGEVYADAFIAESFYGSFAGNGHAISNLTIDSDTDERLSFFRKSYGSVDNLVLEDVSIIGPGGPAASLVGNNYGIIINSSSSGEVTGFFAGGLVGGNYGIIISSYWMGTVTGISSNASGLVDYNEGSISNCYSAGSVTSFSSYSNSRVGGLVASNEGSITNSYSTGEISGGKYTGGLVGANDGSITNGYFSGTVTGNNYVGGLMGFNSTDSITSCYFYLYSGPDNGFGIVLDDEQLQDKNSFAGFDFAGDSSDGIEDNWVIEPGYMPRLAWQDSPGFEVPYALDTITTTLSGSGYSDDPFIIADYADLVEFRNDPNLRIGCYSLINDIDLAGVTYTGAFIPEGFNGSFSGNGHSISNLAINGVDYLGFFSILYGSIDNLALKEVAITGSDDCVGGVAGTNYASITNCYSTGMITGRDYVGGVAGENYCGSITNSYSTGTISGRGSVGGVAGYNCVGNITNSHSTGTVNASNHSVGGVAGYNESSNITNSYSTGAITGSGNCVGGVAGYNGSSNITNSYSTGAVAGSGYWVGGLVGRNYGGVVTTCYSTGEVTSETNYVGGLVGADHSGSINNCFWDIESSGMTIGVAAGSFDPADVMGRETSEMQMQSTFADGGWDFIGETVNGPNDIWRMCVDGITYPKLAWEFYMHGDFVCGDGLDGADFDYISDRYPSDGCGGIFDSAGGSVDLEMFANLAQQWLKVGCGDCQGADLSGDENIDIDDVYQFAEQWLCSCMTNWDRADLDGDGIVGDSDLDLWIDYWIEAAPM